MKVAVAVLIGGVVGVAATLAVLVLSPSLWSYFPGAPAARGADAEALVRRAAYCEDAFMRRRLAEADSHRQITDSFNVFDSTRALRNLELAEADIARYCAP
jgi:hypothetical protein